jgi:hypothetical protein
MEAVLFSYFKERGSTLRVFVASQISVAFSPWWKSSPEGAQRFRELVKD